MLLFHGSNLIVDKPRLVNSNRNLDFGQGFYTTVNQNQAESFAEKVVERERGGKAIVNVYEASWPLPEEELFVLQFETANEEWLDYVAANRLGHYSGAQHDVVVGAVANDDVYFTLLLYLGGAYTKEQTLEELRVKKLYNQVVWKSALALEHISFIRSYEVGIGG